RFDNFFPASLAGGSEASPDSDHRKMFSLSIAKDDIVDFSAEGITASIHVFQTQIDQSVDRAESRLNDLFAYNSSIKTSSDLSPEDKKVIDAKLRIIENARRVIYLKNNPYV